MGSSASKPASRAANAAAKATRQYPSRPSPSTSAPAAQPSTTNMPSRPPPPPAANHIPGPTVHPQARASGQRNEEINLDASDPDFARSLRQLGAVQPNPTLSPSSTFAAHPSSHFPNPYGQQGANTTAPPQRLNPALRVLQARAELAGEAEREFLEAGKRGSAGRRFLDVGTLRSVVTMRDERGMSNEEIERVLGLRSGAVAKLGPKGVVGVEAKAIFIADFILDVSHLHGLISQE
ncbi:hypothetical protein D6D06_02792 [Aureobasidium pullulans]|nr:hypothetical protein D6D06_02792 [Aureobasidium pullulans]